MKIFTDGACSQNGTWEGGHGVVWMMEVNGKQMVKTFNGSKQKTTNNEQELTAMLVGLEQAKNIINDKNYEISVFTDSSYVCDAINKWCKGWEKRGWKKSDKSEVANKELWIKVWDIYKELNVNVYWVRGHVEMKNKDTEESFNKKLEKAMKEFNKKNNKNLENVEIYKTINKYNGLADELATKFRDEELTENKESDEEFNQEDDIKEVINMTIDKISSICRNLKTNNDYINGSLINEKNKEKYMIKNEEYMLELINITQTAITLQKELTKLTKGDV